MAYTNHRVFGTFEQEQFARISGDRNPIHIDPIAARRTHAGVPIVHGVHSVLWALNCFAESDLYAPGVRGLRAQFPRPIYLGDEISIRIERAAHEEVRATLFGDGEEVVTVTLSYQSANLEYISSPPMRTDAAMQPPLSPIERSLDEMENLAGLFRVSHLTAELRDMFPSASRAFGTTTLASLAGTSCLVGMVAPGLYSMFSGLHVCLSQDTSENPDGLAFRVLSLNRRFRLARIRVVAPGLYGLVDAINRMPPTRQLSMEKAMATVTKGEFRSSTVLVIGGSRGLGELSAKLLAAGGCNVVITYASGEHDALSVANEIMDSGTKCESIRYDVNLSASEQLAPLTVTPTHAYYFATPPIFMRKAAVFDQVRFALFNTFYVNGFANLVQACIARRREGIGLFYPSSSALDSRPISMTEYAMSKAAGEILCADLIKAIPGLRILVSRLPRLPTDQTNSTVQSNFEDPVKIMLPIIRELQGYA